MSKAPEPRLAVELHGPKVDIEDAVQAADALKRLLDTVSELVGAPTGWQVGSVQFKCDGCGLLRPDRPDPDEGWAHLSGDDYCPTCVEARTWLVREPAHGEVGTVDDTDSGPRL